MPRTSRAVAQRLASQTRGRKRRTQRSGVTQSADVKQILDEVAPEPEAEGRSSTAAVEATRRASAAATRAANPAVPRRRYSEYAEEYAYVWGDLRRITIVSAILLFLLLALWFVIR